MTARTATVLAICLASCAFVLPAEAQEVPPVVRVLLDNFERQTAIKPVYESVAEDDEGTITIANLSLNKPSAADNPSIAMRIDEIELSEVSDEGDGLFEIGGATFTGLNLDMSGPDFAVTVEAPGGSAEDWYVKAAGDSPTSEAAMRAAMTVARKMSSGPLKITVMRHTITSDGYESTWDGDPATGAGTFTTKFANVAIPEATIAAIDSAGVLKQLGYAGLTFDFTADGKMDIAGGTMDFSMNQAFVGRDMGTLRVSFGAGAIPLAAYAQLQSAPTAGQGPDLAALMPQLQAITVSGAAVRFEDASITRKLLPMLAAMQGQDEATMVASAAPMVQMMLTQLGSPDFAAQASGAVAAFLKEPKSLTVAVKPATPIKVQDLMALNPAAPAEAIARLGVSVTAND